VISDSTNYKEGGGIEFFEIQLEKFRKKNHHICRVRVLQNQKKENSPSAIAKILQSLILYMILGKINNLIKERKK